MKGRRQWRTVATIVAACAILADCSGKTTYTPGPPTAFAALRLTAANGAPDTTFAGGRGIVTTAADSSSDFGLAVALQPVDANPVNNKIVVAGGSGFAGQGVIALVRYNPDGSLDPGFGIGGLVKTPLPSVAATATALAVQPADHKIIVAALTFTAVSADNNTATTGIALLRYNSDGTLDTAGFGAPNGFVTASIGPGFTADTCALALQGDGKIVVAGAASRSGDPHSGDIVVYRYDSSGVLDTAGFGTGGKTTLHLPTLVNGSTIARSPALALQSSGKIVVATGNDADQVVLRLGTDGQLDGTFGTSGVVVTNVGGVDYGNAVAVQSNDKIVVAGHANVTSDTSDISLSRYTVDGAPDTGFGPPNGFVTRDLAGRFDNAISIVLQDQGAPAEPLIVVSGNAGYNNFPQIAVLRYKPDGSLDTSFGPTQEGVVLVNVVGPSTVASGNAVALQAVGTGVAIVVAGYD